MDISRYRTEFPITAHKVFMNHAATAPFPLRAKARLDEWAASALGATRQAERGFTQTVDYVRAAAARLVGCKPAEIAFVPSTSEGISLFAASLDWRVGDSVVLPANEFPSNVYPWHNLKRSGVRIKTVNPTREGRVQMKDIIEAMDSRTRVAAISWVGYNTGFRVDLALLGEECRKRGVHLFADVIQGLGPFQMQAAEWNVAAASAEAHKWLLGTHGIGVLYVSEKLIGGLHPPIVGWRSIRNRDNFMEYDFTLAGDATRFEPGSLNGAGIYLVSGSLELLEEAGIANVTARVKELTDCLCAKLHDKGFEILSPRGRDEWSGIVSFRVPGADGPAAAKVLAAKNIIVTGRKDFLRVSPYFYNTEEEIDRLVAALG